MHEAVYICNSQLIVYLSHQLSDYIDPCVHWLLREYDNNIQLKVYQLPVPTPCCWASTLIACKRLLTAVFILFSDWVGISSNVYWICRHARIYYIINSTCSVFVPVGVLNTTQDFMSSTLWMNMLLHLQLELGMWYKNSGRSPKRCIDMFFKSKGSDRNYFSMAFASKLLVIFAAIGQQEYFHNAQLYDSWANRMGYFD